jgi:hypothetical protein
MRGQWLVRSTEDDGSEVYSLTSHAQDALALVKTLTRERASLSEHRIATIVSAVRRFNTGANPDRTERVSLLDSQIGDLTRERDNLLAGGEMAEVSADYMLEGYGELLSLISALPSDFARVEEAFTALRTQIRASFLADDRSAGELVDDYLARAEALTTATPEGRAFEGAFALLRDPELLAQLRTDLSALLDHPMAGDILQDNDRAELRGTVAMIRRRLDEVLAQRKRVSATLKDFIVTHDITRNRQLDATLRAIEAELPAWLAGTGPRTTVPLPLLPARVNVTHLRERFYDPGNDAGPAPLETVEGDLPATLTLEQLRMQGGPSLDDLRAALAEAAQGPDPVASIGVLFASLPRHLRRPVEIFGLLHLATNGDDVTVQPGTEVYQTIRGDGSTRLLEVPLLTPLRAGTAADAQHAPDESARPDRTKEPL